MTNASDDSGLRCPWCGHNLTSLRSNTCPECGERFILTRPGSAFVRSVRSVVSNSMPCPECGHSNTGFMPRACRSCGDGFTWLQRIFGVRGRIG